jgi:hypothetical protein
MSARLSPFFSLHTHIVLNCHKRLHTARREAAHQTISQAGRRKETRRAPAGDFTRGRHCSAEAFALLLPLAILLRCLGCSLGCPDLAPCGLDVEGTSACA